MFFANAFVLLMDEGKRIIPGDTDEFILAANALRAVRRCQKAFTDHRKADTSFTVDLVAHHRLQRVRVVRGKRPA
jgi:hypothetical protein